LRRKTRSLLSVWLVSLVVVYSGCYSPDQPSDPSSADTRTLDGPAVSPAHWVTDPTTSRPQVVVAAAEVLPLEALVHVDEPQVQGSLERFDAGRSSFASALLVARNAPGGYATVVIPGRKSSLPESRIKGVGSVFDRPFRAWFASVFENQEHSAAEHASVASDRAESAQNPFTDAKRAAESAPSTEPAAEPRARTHQSPTAVSNSEAPTSQGNEKVVPAGASGTPTKSDPGILFLGDFDGTGALKWAQSRRSGDERFAFDDGERSFNLFVNPDAVTQERSFTIEDLNDDGNLDLVVTSRASLFAGVLLGDGAGNFAVADSFVTGYEPTVAIPGPLVDGWRDLLAVDVRTGTLTTFRGGKHYRTFRFQNLDFVPDFAAHLVNPTSGADSFLAGAEGRVPSIFSWREDGLLSGSADTLPADAISTFVSPVGAQGSSVSLSLFQVGQYASVVVSDAAGRKFNVATLRVSPKMFLSVGDLQQNGTLDVAVAFLVPASQK
jgi:hypothetical protein